MSAKNDLQGFAERLNKALDYIGAPEKYSGRQTYLMQQFEISQQAARKWTEGEGTPGRNNLNALADLLQCDTDWLLRGVGVSPWDRVVREAGEQYSTNKHINLMRLFDSLPNSEQNELLNQLQKKKDYYDKLWTELNDKREKP